MNIEAAMKIEAGKNMTCKCMKAYSAMKAAIKEGRFDPTKVEAKAPVGWEGTVKHMKDHPGIDNPWALTNWMKDQGYTSHK